MVAHLTFFLAKYVLLLNDGSLLEKLAAKQNDAGFIDLFIDPFQKMSHDQLKDIIDNDISNDFLKLETKKESLKYWENVKLVLKSLLRGGTTRYKDDYRFLMTSFSLDTYQNCQKLLNLV